MKLSELYNLIDQIAPFALSGEMISRYGAYDNSGILVDAGGEIEKVLFSLDLSLAAVDEAILCGANCVVTHHPAIYAPLKRVEGETAVGRALRAGISVISAHLNLDAASGGIDESLMEALGGRDAEVMQPLTGGGYGRVYSVAPTTMEELEARVRQEMHAGRVVRYGSAPVKKIASFCGGGFDEEALLFAREHGADTIVSSEGRHHLILAATEAGCNLLFLTHACSEEYGFYRFYEKMREKLTATSAYFAEKRFL